VSAVAFPLGAPVAFVATGESFPDALAAGAAAGCAGGPLLLASGTQLPAATAAELRRLHPRHVFVLGAPSTLSAKLEGPIATASGATVDRLSGVDRYATAAAVSAASFGPGVPEAWLATGDGFPDALAAGAAAGRAPAPILLVPSTGTSTAVLDELHRLAPAKLVVLGGQAAVPDTAVAPLRSRTS
jgi:putative cell wall-binding protein